MTRRGWRLDWKGRHIKRQVRTAAMAGIDETTSAAVNAAKQDHGWANRTGTAEGSIQMRPADLVGRKIVGRWGSFDVHYFLYLELGSGVYDGDRTLQRAADREYPELARRIRENMGR